MQLHFWNTPAIWDRGVGVPGMCCGAARCGVPDPRPQKQSRPDPQTEAIAANPTHLAGLLLHLWPQRAEVIARLLLLFRDAGSRVGAQGQVGADWRGTADGRQQLRLLLLRTCWRCCWYSRTGCVRRCCALLLVLVVVILLPFVVCNLLVHHLLDELPAAVASAHNC